MPIKTITKQFPFLSSAEGFVPFASGGLPPSTLHAWASDVGVPPGSLSVQYDGSVDPSGTTDQLSYWLWSGTWRDLGVPSGATVSSIQVSSVYFQMVGDGAAVTSFNLLDFAGANPTKFFGETDLFTQVYPFAEYSGVSTAVPLLLSMAETSIQLQLEEVLKRSSPVSSGTIFWEDQLSLNIAYSSVFFDAAAPLSAPHPLLNAAGSVVTPSWNGRAELFAPHPILKATGTSTPPIFTGSANLEVPHPLLNVLTEKLDPASNTLPLYAYGKDYLKQSLNLFVKGTHGVASEATLPLFLIGGAAGAGINPRGFNILPMSVTGNPYRAILNLSTTGSEQGKSSSTLNLYLEARGRAASVLPLYLHNTGQAKTGYLDLFVRGTGKTWGYVPATGRLNLFASGSGTNLIFPTPAVGTLPLYLHGDFIVYDNARGVINLFLKSDGITHSSSILNLFASGGVHGTSTGTLNLVLPKTGMKATLSLFTHGF